eukprot:GEMP01048394.1.p1 GENE.GEMP01048394.1~~GEMP01048394.1.p1  ORF type:complete len:364 (+),score=95.91 GEMP01048394.1:168-1259(+)
MTNGAAGIAPRQKYRCTHLDTPRCGLSRFPTPLRFLGSQCSRQHPLKTKMGAIFADACELSSTMLGICDGVSEVQNFGIDPALLPKELLLRCKELIESKELSERSPEPNYQFNKSRSHQLWLRDLLEEAYFQTSSEGSTTVLLAAIEEGKLVTVNIGDSGLLLLRPNTDGNYTIVYRTEPLRYDQNRPYQVGRMKGVQKSQIEFVIRQGVVERAEIRHGDVLVLGSDGLFDNLYEEEVVSAVSSLLANAKVASLSVEQLKDCANKLVSSALQTVSIGQVGPEGQVEFGANAKMAPSGHGGKADDTSCIVATIVNSDRAIDGVPSFHHAGVTESRDTWLPKFSRTPHRGEEHNEKEKKDDCVIL